MGEHFVFFVPVFIFICVVLMFLFICLFLMSKAAVRSGMGQSEGSPLLTGHAASKGQTRNKDSFDGAARNSS